MSADVESAPAGTLDLKNIPQELPPADSARKHSEETAKKHLKEIVKHVIWDKRLSKAFASLRTQTGDAYLHLDFKKDLTFVKNLGQGAFGTVDCYMLRDVENNSNPPREVAVKRIKNHVEEVELNAHLEPVINIKHATDEDLEMFFNEVRLMKRLKHPNLVEFVGTGSLREEDDDRELMFLVQEMLPHKLSAVLEKKTYTADQAVQWSLEIARGMQYLHEREPKIVHRDLKPDNILFNADMVAKITDFGLFTVAPPDRPHDRRGSVSNVEKSLRGGRSAFLSVEPSAFSSTHGATYPASSPASMTVQTPKKRTSMEKTIEEGSEQRPRRPSGAVRMSMSSFTNMLRTYSFTANKFNQPNDYKMTGMTGTLKYMAPESYRCETYNEKVDQFAFSMIMYELIVRREPYKNSYMLPQDLAESVAYSNRRPKLHNKLPQSVRELCELCWHADYNARPSFKTIVFMLEKLKGNQGDMKKLRELAASPMAQITQGGGCKCIVC